MITSDLHYHFEYNKKWDYHNIQKYQLLRSREEVKIDREISALQVQMIENSQPKSIYNASRETFIANECFYGILKSAISIQDSYELFLSPWIADGSFSYSNDLIRNDWKILFGKAHNSSIKNKAQVNSINIDRFKDCINYMDDSIKFIIKNTRDSGNYWHWTFENLPRLIILKDLVDNNNWDVELINHGADLKKFQSEWLYAIFGDGLRIKQIKNNAALINNILVIREPFPAHHSSWMIKKVKEYGKKVSENCTVKTSRKLYIQRGNTKNGRNIINEEEVISNLSKRGYQILKMDDLSVQEQIQAFSKAEVIIGAHGAALTNMVYCDKNTEIIEIYHPKYMPGQNMALAQLCKLRIKTLIGTETSNSKIGTRSYLIPITQLIDELEKSECA